MGFVITEIHAFVAVGEDGDEGIISMQLGGVHMPFIVADKVRFERMLPLALQAVQEYKKELRIIKFSTREDVTNYYIPKE